MKCHLANGEVPGTYWIKEEEETTEGMTKVRMDREEKLQNKDAKFGKERSRAGREGWGVDQEIRDEVSR